MEDGRRQREREHEQRSPLVQAERVPLPRWVPPLLGLVAAGLVPWTLWLTFSLPQRHITHHYRVAWVGFDVGLAVAFAATAFTALRFSRWVSVSASITGALLLCDAWFDVVTSGPGVERVEAMLEAGFAEVPLALLCAWIIWDAQRFERSLVYRYARRFDERRRVRAAERDKTAV